MELSSPRFKALTVSAGFTFWFFIITTSLGIFSIEFFVVFIAIVFSIFQILAIKVSKILDYVAIFNTKIFLGILFVLVISFYGIFFRILKIDLLRLKKTEKSYWLSIQDTDKSDIFKQY